MIEGGQSLHIAQLLHFTQEEKNDADKVSVVILPTQEASAINMGNS